MGPYLTYIITLLLIFLPFLIIKQIRKRRHLQGMQSLKPVERRQFELLRQGKFDQFKYLVESINFDPNLREPVFEGTLLMSCPPDDNKINFAEYLIEKGVDLDAVNKKGLDMLFLTTYSKCDKLFDLILKQKNINLNRINFAFGIEMNALTGCIFRMGKLPVHAIRSKDKNRLYISEQERKSLFTLAPYRSYLKACKLLLREADSALCRRLITKFPDQYGHQAEQEFEPMLDFFERWHANKKVFLIDYYLAKEGKAKNLVNTKKCFALEKLPFFIVSKIADEYL